MNSDNKKAAKEDGKPSREKKNWSAPKTTRVSITQVTRATAAGAGADAGIDS